MTDIADVFLPARSVAPESLRDRAARALRAAIISGDMEPDRVYSVPMLAARLGVSATPVREAMLDLVRDRLVQAVPNRGFRVVDVSQVELAELNEVRMLLEPPTVARLAGRLTSLQLEGLRAHVDAVLAAAQRGEPSVAAEAAFVYREVLFGLCSNRQLVDTIMTLRTRARAGYQRAKVDYAKFAANQYELIANLQAGDTDKVARAIEYDIIRFGPPLRRVASTA